MTLVSAALSATAQKLIEILEYPNDLVKLDAEDVTKSLLWARANPLNSDQVGWFRGLKKIVSEDVGKLLYAQFTNPILFPRVEVAQNPLDMLDDLLMRIINSDEELSQIAHSHERPELHKGANGQAELTANVEALDVEVVPETLQQER